MAKEKGKSVAIDESPISKGDLNDLLQAIDIEESPLGQVDLIESGKEKAKKVKASKKLKFDEKVEQFVFNPRRPITRSSNKYSRYCQGHMKQGRRHGLMKEGIKAKQLPLRKTVMWKS